jgi:hypothetical protein
MAQVVEYLPSKLEVLSLKLITAQNKTKENKRSKLWLGCLNEGYSLQK